MPKHDLKKKKDRSVQKKRTPKAVMDLEIQTPVPIPGKPRDRDSDNHRGD
jgi:hypothetical protein